MNILPYIALTLALSVAQADDVYNSATRILSAPNVSVDGKDYINANILLGADGRWSLLSITPPPTSGSIAETCTTTNINLTNFKRITRSMDLAQVTSIIGCNPNRPALRTSSYNTYYWYSDGQNIFISVNFDPNDSNADSFSSAGL